MILILGVPSILLISRIEQLSVRIPELSGNPELTDSVTP